MATEYWFGIHAVEGALAQQASQVMVLYLDAKSTNPRLAALAAMARDAGIALEHVGTAALMRFAGDGHHQGAVVKIRTQTEAIVDLKGALASLDMEKKPVILALEGLQDPHNLGACLRSAAALGVDLVLIPAHRSVGMTPAVRKVACGGAEQVPVIVVPNMVRALENCKEAGFWVVGTSLESTCPLAEAAWERPVVVVMGAEETGLRSQTARTCDELVCITLASGLQSLNVSVATGITLYAIRQARLAGRRAVR